MRLEKASKDELMKDLIRVHELSRDSKAMEEKYENYGCQTLYGLRKSIYEELGKRSVIEDVQ